MFAEKKFVLRWFRSTADSSETALSPSACEFKLFTMIKEGNFGLESSEMNESIHGFEGLRKMKNLILYLFKLFLQFYQFISAFVCLLDDLMLLLNFFYFFIIFDKQTEISIVVVNHLHLEGSLIVTINISPKLHFNCLGVCRFVKELFHCYHIATGVNNGVVLFHFLHN